MHPEAATRQVLFDGDFLVQLTAYDLMSLSPLPLTPLQTPPCSICSHSPHTSRTFRSEAVPNPAFVGEVCFGCLECDRLFGLIGDILEPPTEGPEPLLA